MTAAVGREPLAEPSPLTKARTAGFFWLMTILTGAFAMFAGGRFGLAANLIATREASRRRGSWLRGNRAFSAAY
jgi:hypothetical protein